MKYLVFLLILTFSAKSEEIRVSTEGGTKMVFFNLSDKNQVSADAINWHLSFKSGSIAGTIRANTMVKVYEGIKLNIDNFKSAILENSLADTSEFRLVYNSDIDWKIGAFNQGGLPEEDFNYGWGEYVQGDGIYGRKLYVLEITINNKKEYFQFTINSVISSIYSISWSNLDGTNDKTLSINKKEFSDKHSIYLNLVSGELLNIEPTKPNWNLLFAEYITPIPNGGTFLYYPVAGILQNPNTWVAQLEGDIASAPTSATYSTDMSSIGYDWKTYTDKYVIEDRTYFAQNFKLDENGSPIGDGNVYRIRFLNYEGGKNKASTFDISSLTTSVGSEGSQFGVYPNMISSGERFNIVSSSISGDCNIQILSVNGQIVYENQMFIGNELSSFSVDKQLSPGLYFVKLNNNKTNFLQKLIVK